jgi:thioredoxin 1
MELNESNFQESVSDGVSLVDFYAPWCGPCKAMSPVLETIQNCNVFKVNTDENTDLAVQFSISSIPCLVFMKDGVEVNRITGMQSKGYIQKIIDELNAE